MTIERTSPETFGSLLRSFRERVGLSQSALARRAGLDPSFVNRLESGQRSAERSVAEKLVEALELGPAETDRLLAAGGYLPAAFERIVSDPEVYDLIRSLIEDPASSVRLRELREALRLLNDPALRLVTRILGDERLPPTDRDELRQVITLIARRWLPPAGHPG